ncbi:PREDICTED: sclerostin domain-containing protein 1-like [Priapulus caudatus]|uniref:Sclerostin domain-containing protein 1-like n=1 Tax=Priapulus caudatus TaxID=37621 RepID=A0ABM1F1K7_PRICU|nr:PREDICTED: sclerostin domain-containing protein 1-like [Priapulus caudatus]
MTTMTSPCLLLRLLLTLVTTYAVLQPTVGGGGARRRERRPTEFTVTAPLAADDDVSAASNNASHSISADKATSAAEATTPPDIGSLKGVQLGCDQQLRSKRYISDGYCTSLKPITEVVCAGRCLPVRTLPWYASLYKVWAKTKTKEWRCVENRVRRQRVSLMCQNGEQRTYQIKVVKSCKCKRYNKRHNQSRAAWRKRQSRRARKRRRRACNASVTTLTHELYVRRCRGAGLTQCCDEPIMRDSLAVRQGALM